LEIETPAARRRPRLRRFASWLWKLPLLFVLVTASQVLLLRVIDPPFSSFMAIRQLQALVHGDWSFRIAQDWRDLSRISPNLPLALVAAEDQNFPHHHGFDFAAIDKARAHNARMVERAERRGTPVRRLRGASTISQQTAKNLFLWAGNGPTRWLRKGLEAWYTVLLETLWPKSRILEMYANFAEFGDGIYGAQAAARSFWDKDASRLPSSTYRTRPSTSPSRASASSAAAMRGCSNGSAASSLKAATTTVSIGRDSSCMRGW
jgi:monofunctional biosynthetic peptidoglycan transglycosylase